MSLYSDLSSVDPPPHRGRAAGKPAGRHGRIVEAPGTRVAVAGLANAVKAVDKANRQVQAMLAESDATAGELARRIDALQGEALQLQSLAAATSRTIRARTRRSPLTGGA